MSCRGSIIIPIVLLLGRMCIADDVIYRYEGDVVPYDESAGWIVADPCEYPCTESVENGRFVLHWARPADRVNYHLWIARPEDPPAPATLWVEWHFRSNHPIGPYFYTCDGKFKVKHQSTFEVVFMYGDAAISFSGADYVGGLAVEEFQTYRFESLDGMHYWLSVDGATFAAEFDDLDSDSGFLQFGGGGGCERFFDTINEWDFIRFGTISFGEQIIASDPAEGFLDARVHAGLDRFTVTFDDPNYVYLDEITVEVTGGDTPEVVQTRRQDNGAPDTVEIVLDRPIPMGETTTFTFYDGVAINVVEYTFAPGDTNGDGLVDLADIAAFQCCFGQTDLTGACLALDLIHDDHITLDDYAILQSTLTSP